MNDRFNYQVLVAGAGPVGATLGLDLARCGIGVCIVEQSSQPRKLPKMERCNARSMEIFRRLGVAETIRAATKFRDVPMDVFVLTDFFGPPLLHLRYPSAVEAQKQIAVCRDDSMPLEPYQLISQYTLEPLLRQAAQKAGAEIRMGTKLVSFTQDGEGVTAQVEREGGAIESIRARYLVGCDGGVSTVRKQIGIALEGDGRLRLNHQVFFRSEQLFDSIPIGRARHYYFPEGTIVVQDDLRHFMINYQDWQPGMDAKARVQALTGEHIDVEILSEADWYHHLLVAQRYREQRVFIAGDAAHLVIPQGALGMNTGVGDAADLAWKLVGTLQGWGGPGLLDSYEPERREIGLRNREASRAAARGVQTWKQQCGPEIREDSERGRTMRAKVAQLAAQGQPIGHEFLGVELGYRYSDSLIVFCEPPTPFDASDMAYHPSAVPGARLPHMWRDDGAALHDQIAAGYTLLRLGQEKHDTGALEQAMRGAAATRQDGAGQQVPFAVLDVPEPRLRAAYGSDIILLRPDLHIAWRGNLVPSEPREVAAVVTGH